MEAVEVVLANQRSSIVRRKVSEEFQIGQNAFRISGQPELGFCSRFPNQLGEIYEIAVALDSFGDGVMFKSLDDQ